MQYILDKQHEIHRSISPSKLVLHGTSLATHDFTRKLATLHRCFILGSTKARNSLSNIQFTDDSCKIILIKPLDATDRLFSLFSINPLCSSSSIYGQVHDYHIQEACHSNVYLSIPSQINDVKMKERAATMIQSYLKAWHGRKKYLDVKRSVIKIQANFRMKMARQKYLRLLACVVLLQKLFKDSRTFRLLDFQQRRQKAATIIQAQYRGWKVRCMVSKWHDAARRIQLAWHVYQQNLISPSENIYLQHPLEIHSGHEICEEVLASGASYNEAQACLPFSDSCSISCTISTNKITMACDYSAQVGQNNTDCEQCICSSPVKKPTGLESYAGIRTVENHVPSVGGLLGVSKRNEKCHVFSFQKVEQVPAIVGDISYSCPNTSANMPEIFKDNSNDNRSRIRMKTLSQHEKKLQQFAKVFLLHHQISMVQYRAQFAPPYPPSQNGQIQSDEDSKSKASLTVDSIGKEMFSGDVSKVSELDFVIDIELLTKSQNLTCFTDMQSTLIDPSRTKSHLNQQCSASLLENVTSMAFKAISIRHATSLDAHNILLLLLALVVYTKSVCRSVVGWTRKQ